MEQRWKYLDDVPPEILTTIIKYLNREEQRRSQTICRKWSDLIKALWSCPGEKRSLGLVKYEKSTPRLDGKAAAFLDMDEKDIFDDEVFWIMIRDNPAEVVSFFWEFERLESLEIDRLNDQMLYIIDRCFPNLKRLAFHEITEITIWGQSQIFPELDALFEPHSLGPLLSNIEVLFCPQNIFDNDLTNFVKWLKKLRTLGLIYIDKQPNTSILNGDFLNELENKGIEHLILANLPVDEIFFNGLTSKLKQLKEIEVLGSAPNEALDALTSLSSDGTVTCESLEKFSFNCQNLMYNSRITRIKRFHRLTSLCLFIRGYSDHPEDREIEEDFNPKYLYSIVEGLPSLISLDIIGWGCFFIDIDIQHITKYCHTLQKLSIDTHDSKDHMVTDISAKSISSLPYLHTLILPHTDITYKGLKMILKNCNQLKTLRLNNSPNINNHCLDIILQHINRNPQILFDIKLYITSVDLIGIKIPPNSKICACPKGHRNEE